MTENSVTGSGPSHASRSKSRSRPWAPLKLLRRCAGLAWRGLGLALIAPVRAYQLLISPLLPPACRFEPSCSEYMVEAIRKKGPLLGLLKGLWRLARCNPLCRSGYDPVKKQDEGKGSTN